MCDSALRRCEVPQETLDKLEDILSTAIQERFISFATLEKLAGKCIRMSVAVPPAGLYIHYIHSGSRHPSTVRYGYMVGYTTQVERGVVV